MPLDSRPIVTLASLAILGLLVVVIRVGLGKRLRGIKGYGKFLNLVILAITIGVVAELGYTWGIFELLIGSVAAAGAIGIVLAWGMLPVITDVISGILIHLDTEIDVGEDVEIDGKRGVINEISLTRTRVINEEYTALVPNRRFRETVVLIRKRR